MSDALRILSVDDDEVDRMIVSRALRDAELDADLAQAEDVDGALAQLAAGAPFDCIILDFSLPGGDAFDVLRRLRDAGSDVPVIILTGHGDEELAVELMKAGAFDYMSKVNLRPARLGRGVRAALQLRQARQERQHARDALRETADRQRFLAEASRELAMPRELDGALRTLARIAVPRLGDACIVYLDLEGEDQQVAAAHAEPAGAALVARLEQAFRPERDSPASVIGDAMRTARLLNVPEIDDGLIRAVSPSRSMLETVRALAPRSAVVAPLVAREQTLGAVVFVRTGVVRPYEEADLMLAEDLAQRAATSIDNVRLFDAAERARAVAEEANLAKSHFLAAMSHDLRTPLNAIGGYAQLVAEGIHGPVTPAQRSALGRVVAAQEHLLTLINDILGFARIEAGQLELRIEAVPIGDTLAGLGALIEPQRNARSIAYEYLGGTGNVRVCVDRERLLQIMLNLLTNALKFTPDGGRITVSWESTGSMARVHVTDTGRGVPAEMQEAIFDPFVQVGRAASESTGAAITPRGTGGGAGGRSDGVGLGLAISRELAQRMGGDLHLVSSPGKGSTFTVLLPLAGDAAAAPARAEELETV
jgi:signal transduction histidine kinase/DNA-binding response OmpR family regulator